MPRCTSGRRRPAGSLRPLALSRLDSPVGRLVFAADDSLLRALEFYESEDQLRAKLGRSLPEARFAKGAGPSFVIDALGAYFGGDVTALESVRSEERRVGEECR